MSKSTTLSLLTALQETTAFQRVILAVILISILGYASLFRKHSSLDGAPPLDSEGLPGFGPLRFWTDRMNYMQDAGRRSKNGNFSFYVGRWPVIGLTGPSGRAAYYNTDKKTSISDGMGAFIVGSSGLPHDPNDPNVQAKKDWEKFSRDRLTEQLRVDRLQTVLPTFFDYCDIAYVKLGQKGSVDPMIDIYALTWALTMRVLGPAEIYESPELLRKTFNISLALDSILGGAEVFFTWLPTPKKVKKTVAGIRLFLILGGIFKARRKAMATGKGRKDDTLQMMLDRGDWDASITKHMINMLFTAQINTAQNTAAVLCYLGSYPAWRKRVREELETVAAKYAKDKSAPLAEQLRDIPQDVWDSGLPILYACCEESIRINTVGSFCRKNVTDKPMPLYAVGEDGMTEYATEEVIPPGAIVMWNMHDAKGNPDYFPDPDTWNPSRFLPQDGDFAKQSYAEVPHVHIPWGSAKHTCTGVRLAKLEMHIVIATFVANFEWDTTDGSGKVRHDGVPADWDAWLPTRPLNQYRLRYKRRIDEKGI